MRGYNIGSIIMIIVLAVFTGIVAGRLLWLWFKKTSKVEFRNYIKTYKFGKFLWVYLLAIPLFAMSYHYSGYIGFDCFFRSFTSASKLFALQFDVSLDLVKVNDLYKATVILCYCIAILNLLLFVTSCLVQVIWNGLARHQFLFSKNDKCLILGNNPKNELFYNSIENVKNKKVKRIIADVLDKSGKWDLYTKDIHYRGCSSIEDLQKWIEKLLQKFDNKFKKAIKKGNTNEKFPKFQIVINFADINKNANMCTFLSSLISSYAASLNKDAQTKLNNYLPYLDVYIYTTKETKSLYQNLNNEFSGCLHLINEQESIATDFIQKYPVAKYLDEKQINYDTSLLKDKTKISISFVGFGDTQQEIFKSLYSNTQFVKEVNGEIVAEHVDYHIYDKEATWEEQNFRTSFNRYRDEFLSKPNKDGYYPLAQMSEPKFIVTDITSNEFANESAKVLQEHNTGNNLKYIVISLGNDFASLDYANKLWKTIKTKNIKNCHLFVKVNDVDSYNNIARIFNSPKEQIETNSRNVYGCLIDSAYNYEHVVMGDITDLSILIDELWSITAGYSEGVDRLDLKANIVENARNNWDFKKEYNRYSSICAVLNLRSKLLTMGLDYAKYDDPRPELFSSNQEYWDRLDSEKFRTKAEGDGVDYLKLIYDNNDHYFNTKSRRWALIVAEHNRWNAFERTIGFIPLEKSEVVNKGIENDKEKGLHPCITTMRGLEALQQDLVAYATKKTGKPLSQEEVNKRDKIQLDILQPDSAWAILKKIGYKIVSKE